MQKINGLADTGNSLDHFDMKSWFSTWSSWNRSENSLQSQKAIKITEEKFFKMIYYDISKYILGSYVVQ